MANLVGPYAPSVEEVDEAVNALWLRLANDEDIEPYDPEDDDPEDDDGDTLVFSHNGLWMVVALNLKAAEAATFQHAMVHAAEFARVSACLSTGRGEKCACCGEPSWFAVVSTRSEADLEKIRVMSENLEHGSPN